MSVSSVLDTPYVVENGKMVMETDLDLNGKSLLNYNPPKSKAVIHGLYTMQSDGSTFTIDGDVTNDDTVFGFDFTIKKVTLSVRLFRSRVMGFTVYTQCIFVYSTDRSIHDW